MPPQYAAMLRAMEQTAGCADGAARHVAAAVCLLLGTGIGAASADPIGTADLIEVFKARHELMLMRGGVVLKTYRVALGVADGAKRREGDRRTPEGRYVIDYHNPHSAFHLALHISYPNAANRASAAALGLSPGGAIMIHGLPKGLGWVGAAHQLRDWTNGCVAVTDEEIEEIARAVPDGTPIVIHP